LATKLARMGLRRLELPARMFSTVRLSGSVPGLMISRRSPKRKRRISLPKRIGWILRSAADMG
jgi:hypothetical protein